MVFLYLVCMRKLIRNTQHQFNISLTMVCQYPALVWRSFAYELHTFAYELRSFAHGLRTLHACSATLASAMRIYLLRNVCSAITRRFILAYSKFDGARRARGVCLAHLGDSTAHVWRAHSANEDPIAYVAAASPASVTGALRISAIDLWDDAQ